MRAIFSLMEKNFYVRFKYSCQIKRRVLIDTGSCVNALPESLFNYLELNNSKLITSEKLSCNSVRIASGRRVPIN